MHSVETNIRSENCSGNYAPCNAGPRIRKVDKNNRIFCSLHSLWGSCLFLLEKLCHLRSQVRKKYRQTTSWLCQRFPNARHKLYMSKLFQADFKSALRFVQFCDANCKYTKLRTRETGSSKQTHSITSSNRSLS